MQRETNKTSALRKTEILLARDVLDSDIATVARTESKAPIPELAGLDRLAEQLAAQDMSRERGELAQGRASLARDRETLSRERATLAKEGARIERAALEAAERATASLNAELERSRAELERDRLALISDRVALERDRDGLESDRRHLARERELFAGERTRLEQQARTARQPDPDAVEAAVAAVLAKRRAEIEEAQKIMREDLDRERLEVEAKLGALERERREVDQKLGALEETRRVQSNYAQTLMAQEDDLDVERRRVEEDRKKVDDLVKTQLARSMDRALAGERARLEETRARLAAREAELEKKAAPAPRLREDSDIQIAELIGAAAPGTQAHTKRRKQPSNRLAAR